MRNATALLSFSSLIGDNNSSLRVSSFVQTFKFACPCNTIASIHKSCSTLKDTAQFWQKLRVRIVHAPPQEPKRTAWWVAKDILKMIQKNVIMIELTISVNFKQFEDPNFFFRVSIQWRRSYRDSAQGAGGWRGRLTSDTEWGADDTFFSVTLYNFQKGGRTEPLPASPPPRVLASPRTLQTLCFRNLHCLSF